MEGPALEYLASREDLGAYGPNAIGLLALELRFQLDDIRTVADSALTDGTGDKKCDLLFVDKEQRTAVIAQIYVADDPSKTNPSTNKAADLNTALAWIVGDGPLDGLPVELRSATQEFRASLVADDIDTVEVWYVHNLGHSHDVETELGQVTATASALLGQYFPDATVDVRSLQVDRERLNGWYRSAITAVYVTETIEVRSTSGAFEESGDGWKAVCTSIPASWLKDLHEKHGDDLFSANVRGPMPRRRSKENINYRIELTARTEPSLFWSYNNGITAVVNSYTAVADGEVSLIEIEGIAIVNGAQTTGAIARVDSKSLATASVLARFVQCDEPSIVQGIIDNNNRQNPIKPSDFRSNDPHQERLRYEFQEIPEALYLGARRGGHADSPRKPSNFVSSDTAAQALAAFHLDPGTAYNDLRLIWDRNETYARFFHEGTTARHVVFAFSLLRAVQEWKGQLIAGEQGLDEVGRNALAFLRKRGATFLFLSAISASVETVMATPIPNRFKLSFGTEVSPAVGSELWMPLVDALGSFAPQLDREGAGAALPSGEKPDDRIAAFQQIVRASKAGLESVFAAFRSHVVVD